MLEPRISGTRDYVGTDAALLQQVRTSVEQRLRTFGYAPIDPPILERTAPFLNRSGEDIRRRMYIFQDPKGRELCLRPELTIPAARAFLRYVESAEGAAQAPLERETRLSYVGQAFRYESTSEGRYRQFYQAGAELIGATHREAADAEVLALAVETLEGAGIGDLDIRVGDVAILNGFIDGLGLGERTKARLRRSLLRGGDTLTADAPAAPTEAQAAAGGDLGTLLATLPAGEAEMLISEVLALADIRHVGGRTPGEIVERLAARRPGAGGDSISGEVAQGLRELLAIQGTPESAFAQIGALFGAFGIAGAEALVDRCAERLRYFQAYFDAPRAVTFDVAMRRGLEYYTGFVFEIQAAKAPQLGQLCGGGRYDTLLESLGAKQPTPAVGMGLGLDRLVLALKPGESDSAGAGPDAIVVSAGDVPRESCIRVSRALRAAGWAVETESSETRPRSAIRHADRRGVPYVVFVGEEELAAETVRIKRLADHDERTVPVSGLAAYVAGEGETGR